MTPGREKGIPARVPAPSLFKTKSPDLLIKESEEPDRALKRSLGPVDLTCVGIGAIIGAGIFVYTGTAAAGDNPATADALSTPIINYFQHWITHAPLVLGRSGAGPALVISYLIVAVACGLAALCYSELAAMIPVSGSAYTYSYATLGEIVAWVIGWDLILEYAVGNMAVAVGWSGYLVALCHSAFGIRFPLWLVSDYGTAMSTIGKGGDALTEYSSTNLPHLFGHAVALNLPALIIVGLVTILLVRGVRESAHANTAIVILKIAVVIFFIAFGSFFVDQKNWHPFMPNGISGVMSGAAIIFFAYIGFDAVSTTAEEARNPQRDLPIGMIASLLVCTVLYVLMSGVLTGIRPYSDYLDVAAPIAKAFAGVRWVQAVLSAGALAGMTSVLLVFQYGQPRIFMSMARDGLLPPYFARVHPKFCTPHITTIWTGVAVGGVAMFTDISTLGDLTSIGTLFAFVLVCVGVVVLRRTDPGRARPFRAPLVPLVPILGALMCGTLMLALPLETWGRFFLWLFIGLAIYFLYGRRHSRLQHGDQTAEQT